MSNDNEKIVLARNIQAFLDYNKKSRRDICHALGLKCSTFSNWMQGTKYPRIDKIEAMAKFFRVTKADLIEEHSPYLTVADMKAHEQPGSVPEPQPPKKVKIPVLGSVIAGHPRYIAENIIGYEEVTEDFAKTGELFCLKVKGSSMYPRFEEGDVLIIKSQNHIENGDIAVVMINGDEATVKKVKFKDDGILLIAYNNDVYEPTFYSKKDIESLPVSVIGKVVAMKREL